jgi:hypothetical protein
VSVLIDVKLFGARDLHLIKMEFSKPVY